MGQHLSPRYGQVILVSGYPVLTAVNWSQHWCAICVQYQSSCAPRLARKCEIEHWFSCGADGRAGGRTGGRCTVTWVPNFLGWVDLLTHVAPQARFARQSSAKNENVYCCWIVTDPHDVNGGYCKLYNTVSKRLRDSFACHLSAICSSNATK